MDWSACLYLSEKHGYQNIYLDNRLQKPKNKDEIKSLSCREEKGDLRSKYQRHGGQLERM